MKRNLAIGTIVCLLFVACTQSKEDIVKEEFKEYVCSNFDDPKNLKEIVSIEQIDTVTYENVKHIVELLHNIDNQSDTLWAIEHDMSGSIFNKLANQRYGDSYYRAKRMDFIERIKELKSDLLNFNYEYGEERYLLRDSVDNLMHKMEGLCMNQYKIKTRVKDKESLKLQEYYALEDSTGFRFFEHKPTFNDYSESAALFYKVANEYEEIITIRSNIINETIKVYREVNDFIN